MVEYKLYYFNIRGRAELIRILFAAAGQKYEDIRFEKDNWAEYKAKTPFGQVPFLEVHDGSNVLKLSQSLAITRYLAKKFGLAGKDENEQATMEMYGEQITDLANELVKAYKETDEARKEEMTKKLTTEVIPLNFKLFEEKVASSGSGFFAASGLTWVDLYLFVLLEWLAEKKAAILPHFPHIKALDEKIASHPSVAEWLKSRPVTPM